MAWNWYEVIHLLMRWMHVIAGITWIGHLYFFNFVNVPLQAALDADAKKALGTKLMSRALWWFRWGAMLTLLAGLWLFVQIYMYSPGVGFGTNRAIMYEPEGGIAGRALWIMVGMTLGIIMWFNVWFIIWPTQKKILGGSAPADSLPALRRRAYLTSRVNTYLSAPMLFCMLAPSHYGAFGWPAFLLFGLIGMALIAHAIMFSPKVGTSI